MFMVTNAGMDPPGLAGGGHGAPGRLLINDDAWEIGKARMLVQGDVVTMETAGGGGVGPAQR